MNKTCFIAVVGTASLVASAEAGYQGFAAFSRTVGANRVIDVFAVCSASTDRILNVFNLNVSATGGALPGFVQQAGLSTRGWGRDAATSSRSNGTDSFMTIGADGGGPYYGVWTASAASPDGNFSNWGGSGAPNSATGIAANAGWFFSPPTGGETLVEDISNSAAMGFGSGTITRINGSGVTGNFGVWISHLVLTEASLTGLTALNYNAAVTLKTPTDTGVSQPALNINLVGAVPAPGALALIGVAGFASRRRRA